jgi:hypothetical protein
MLARIDQAEAALLANLQLAAEEVARLREQYARQRQALLQAQQATQALAPPNLGGGLSPPTAAKADGGTGEGGGAPLEQFDGLAHAPRSSLRLSRQLWEFP